MFEGVEAFYRPATAREALHLLHRGKGRARIVSGCTDLVLQPDRNIRFLIDITHAGLSYIRRRNGWWQIGATTTMADIEDSAELQGVAGGLLPRAAATCGAIEIRNMATVGGNMANGSPAADLATPLLALDAEASVESRTSGRIVRRKMPLGKYLGEARSRGMRNSLLVGISFHNPPAGARCGWSFQKLGRTAIDISLVNAAAGLGLDVRGRVRWARLALGAVAPAPLRMAAIEAATVGRTFGRSLIDEVCEVVRAAVQPIDDQRASADYRRHIAGVLTKRALEECAEPVGCCL